MLDQRVYEDLVKESVMRFGDAKHISAIVNEKLMERARDHSKLLEMAQRTKTHHLTGKEFEESRSELSRRFET